MLACAFVFACASRTPTPPAWAPDEHAAFERARAEHKGVMIEFYAAWSMPSVDLDKRLHADAIAAEFAPKFVPVKIDVTDDNDAVAEIRARYTSQTTPDLVFVGTDGLVLDRVLSLPSNEQLAATIHRAAARVR